MIEKGLIKARREGKFVTYSITQNGINWLNGYKGLNDDKLRRGSRDF
jgi:predicted transcriptional regulator